VAGLIEPPLPTGGRVTRTFDYLGLSLAAAARAGKWRVSAPGEGAQLYEVDDPGVATGQVVWQVPLPGTKQHGSETGAQLFIAVHPAPPCRADQLKGRYQNGQAVMAGMHLGSIELVDASPHACSLRGRIELQGLSSTGQADTETYSQPVGPPVVLSPRTTLWTFRDARATALIATFGFIGSSAAPDGPCQTRNITPSAWTITLSNGTALRITNHAPGNGGPFYTCQGSLTHGVDRGVEILGT
jgi:hypothetical protein